MISIAQAQELVLATLAQLPAETVTLDDALGRVLAQDVVAAADVPRFASSAMDGYAVQAGPAGRSLRVVGEARAGTPATVRLGEGEAIRISTGAALPEGATAVIPQERVSESGPDAVTAEIAVQNGASIRGPGEDLCAGARVLGAGETLGPAQLAVAAAAGAGAVAVARRPMVAVMCTGDELRAPGEPLAPGEIHNSNAPMLIGLARRCGALVGGAERLPDDRGATEDGIRDALRRSDVVLISGGVSVGPHDHVKPALGALGVRELFWRVALQPGRPTWFGVADDGQLVFGLPGNPVSSAVTFSLFAAPALAALQGAAPARPTHPDALLATDVGRLHDREQALRVRLRNRDGAVVASPNGAQGSHILSSLLGADALALIPAGDGDLPAGTRVALAALAG
ncbi:MAG: molybdopterin molybdotransferase MoeA [Solirubrobacteraceae bacterium]